METKMVTKSNKQSGFTLVELAIVLVIIGLIVSGVLVGQNLIKAAELRATVRQLQSFQVAVNTFIGKYSGIPGDINNGNKFGLTGLSANQDGTAGDGDGNGVLTEDAAATILTWTGEMSTFWSHLTTAGKELIPGVYNGDSCAEGTGTCTTGVDFPKLKFGATGWGVFSASSVNYFTTGVVSGDDSVTNTTVDFVPIDAYNIDSKIDDGVPTTGDVQTRGLHATVLNTAATTNAGASTTVCNNTTPSPAEYQYTATAAQCLLRFKMQTF
jgi:prepilin-type N-terminal cleavage/methylation domain-containing protein